VAIKEDDVEGDVVWWRVVTGLLAKGATRAEAMACADVVLRTYRRLLATEAGAHLARAYFSSSASDAEEAGSSWLADANPDLLPPSLQAGESTRGRRGTPARRGRKLDS
jgi:hypothetical protein